MGLTVFAENMGLFHKGSGGKSIAPADVCLTPPTPPAGPLPIPYVNMLSASDLADGSSTVKIDGEPTALEDSSNVATSTGDEPGTQGGNVVTHQTKGKGYFTLWSFTVKVEGKGVCRNGDLMEQNCASKPPGCVSPAAITRLTTSFLSNTKPCAANRKKSKRHAPTAAQKKKCYGGPCWKCGATHSGRKNGKKFTPDHQPPQKAAWLMGGCHNTKEFEKWAKDPGTVKPHCKSCSNSQGGTMSQATEKAIRSWM
jgi:uncharacterized Zn-binding protein involved in type VI secretion